MSLGRLNRRPSEPKQAAFHSTASVVFAEPSSKSSPSQCSQLDISSNTSSTVGWREHAAAMLNPIRTAVSKKKRRFIDEENGFDLDLTCILLVAKSTKFSVS